MVPRATRTALLVLVLLFLAGHLPLLPPSLEDIDSINFALGVRDYDVARHQPHPPGYPLFVALGKISVPLLDGAGVAAPEARGLALWSALAGALAIPLLFLFFQALDGDPRRAFWAVILTATAPLFWFTALRPLSDMTGLTVALAAQALLAAVAAGRAGAGALVAGAFVAGLAIGFRSQTFVLTLPLLALATAAAGARVPLPQRAAVIPAFLTGVSAWAVPLLIASGGLTEYLVALGSQAGEDFEGVEMLWLAPTPRVLAGALLHTLLWPWGHLVLGGLVTAMAVLGLLRAGRRTPRAVVMLAVAYGPYAVFHMLFQEFEMVRYALPLVVPAAWLVARALDSRGAWLPIGASALAAASLILTIPAAWHYGTSPSPGARLMEDVRGLAAERAARKADVLDVGHHLVFRRHVQWQRGDMQARVLKAPHGREWLTLEAVWRRDPDQHIAFAADPRRTDLALIDPQARRLLRSYRWEFPEPPFVGGSRPAAADLYFLRPPNWMLARGWALTAEIGGITARDRLGPHVEPALGWVRSRRDEALLMLGGRHVGPDAGPARVTVTVAGRALGEFDISPGAFFQLLPVPAGMLAGVRPFLPIEVAAVPVLPGAAPVPVRLEQFDLQPPGVVMLGYQDGWHEPEYNRKLGRGWRWMSERAVLWVRPVERDVTLRLSGESPLRYFNRPPVVRVLVGGTEVGRFEPSADFTETVVIPAGLLAGAGGQVVLESDLWFVPPGPDPRRLGLRIYDVVGSL